MSFAAPAVLWGLLLLPLALIMYGVAQRRRGRVAARFTNLALLPNLAPQAPGWRRHASAALYLLALSALLMALARPQAVVTVPQEQATIVLVMDTSISMIATDVQPNRLTAARTAGQRFLDTVPEPFRVAVVSFSTVAQTLTIPTVDRQAAREALGSLRAEGGTAMGDALEHALQVVRDSEAGGGGAGLPIPAPSPTPASAPPAAILLLSDGANTAGQTPPLEAAARARALGVPVYTIALGTPGGTIESPDAPGSGQRLAVPPDESTLRQIAELTGGRFFNAATAADLRAVYDTLGTRLGEAEEQREVTAAFAAAATALMGAGGALALRWFHRFP